MDKKLKIVILLGFAQGILLDKKSAQATGDSDNALQNADILDAMAYTENMAELDPNEKKIKTELYKEVDEPQ